MKTKVSIINILISLAIFLGGCNFLDYDESTHYNIETAFDTFERQQMFLTNVYSFLPITYGTVGNAMRSAACDEAVFINMSSAVHDFNNGAWSALNPIDDGWQFFTGIRQANLFLDQSKGQTFDDIKHNYEYGQIMEQFYFFPFEARFLRAYFYFELARRYGAVPLITTVLTEEEANRLTRMPFEQIIEFIVSECDAIAPELPASYSSIRNADLGRATRGMAMALKSKALLYAASPLFNPSGDVEKWKRAAQAAGDMIKIATTAINQGGLGYSIPTLANLTSATWNRNYAQNTELILGVMRGASSTFESQNYPVGIVGGGSTGHCPTQNLVDAYETRNGLPVSASAGYQEVDPAYNPDNPYANRDPRLENAIVLNNTIWPTRYAEPIEIWRGGKSGKPVTFATSTGYYLKKYVVGNVELRPGYTASTQNRTWMLLRLSEVLLNYAEAMVEAYGDYNAVLEDLDVSAREAVRRVRARSGVAMPAFPETLTVEEFKLKLRNERKVEFAFEDQRFWDVRRWKIADQITDIYGVDIEKTGENTFTYTPTLVERRIFTDNMYLYPIPERERLINPSLTQNPGW